jgi:hypothetical protein
MVDFINSWAKGNKKSTKIDINVRFGRITVLKLMLDFGKEYELMVLNFGVCICHGS